MILAVAIIGLLTFIVIVSLIFRGGTQSRSSNEMPNFRYVVTDGGYHYFRNENDGAWTREVVVQGPGTEDAPEPSVVYLTGTPPFSPDAE